MQPLTIVHVSTQRGWHGGEEQARLLATGLRARGHRCLVLARAGGKFAERLGQAGFEVQTTRGSGRSLWAMRQTRRWLKTVAPDVIHFHDPHALSGAGLAAWRLAIPARVASRRVDFPIRSAWRYRRLANRVIAISQAVADVCQASGVEERSLRIVHSGVDPTRARSGNRQRGRTALGVADNIPVLLCVATLTDHKGHKYLLQAMPTLLRRFPSAQLLLAGDGELRGPLEDQCEKLGIKQAVRFLGYRSDVPDLLHAADLFVLASHMEGLCTTLVDATFAHAPIVACRAGGIPEVFASKDDHEQPLAKLVPPRNPEALATVMVDALANPSAMREMVARAALHSEQYFTNDQMVEGSLSVYRELLAEHPAQIVDKNLRKAA